MDEPQCTVRIQRQKDALWFQVLGRATMHQSMPLRRQGELSLTHGVCRLRVDLSQCAYMDSTFLGTLLYLKRAADRQGPGDLALVSPTPTCRQLLRQLGLDTILPIVTSEECPEQSWVDLPQDTRDTSAWRSNLLEAHQELANLGGQAGAAFRSACECLEREVRSDSTAEH